MTALDRQFGKSLRALSTLASGSSLLTLAGMDQERQERNSELRSSAGEAPAR